MIIYFTYDISQFILMSPYYVINYQHCVIKVVPVLVMETHGRVYGERKNVDLETSGTYIIRGFVSVRAAHYLKLLFSGL